MDVTCLSERARLSSRVIMKPGVKSWTRFTSFACSRDSILLCVRGRAFGRAPSRSDNKKKKKTTLVLKSSWTSGLCSLPPALEETMNTHYGVQQQWYGRWLCVRKASRETISVLFFLGAALDSRHRVAPFVWTGSPPKTCSRAIGRMGFHSGWVTHWWVTIINNLFQVKKNKKNK